MRILITHEALAGAGGVESYLEGVMPALHARGHEVALLHFNRRDDPGPTRLEFEGVPTVGVADVGMAEALRRVSAWKPDVCFSHNMRHLDVDEQLLARAPVVKMMHGYFGTCISGQKCHTFPAMSACTRSFGVGCLTLYFPRRCGQLRPQRMFEQFGWASRQRRLMERYSSVVVASRHMAEEYRRNGVPEERLATAPLFPAVGAGLQPRARPSMPTVLFAGRMTSLKGPRVLVRAVAGATRRLGRPVHLILAGEGPERDQLRQLARSLGVEAQLPGWVSGGERAALMRRATLVAVPSQWPEPFGIVGLEAAAHGVPAVAFDVGGISQWLRDGVNGRLVPADGGEEAFGAVLAEVLADPERLGIFETGATGIAAEMSLEAHLDILEDVLRRARRPSALAQA